jgi:hypothetical protein
MKTFYQLASSDKACRKSLKLRHIDRRIKVKLITVRQPRYSKEEFTRRGNEIYESHVRPQVDVCRIGCDFIHGEQTSRQA